MLVLVTTLLFRLRGFDLAFGNLGLGSEQKEHADLAEINMIPLVDVMLVLLIIFMVAAPLSISGIKVNLPVSKAKGVAVQDQKTILSIDKDGNYFIDKVGVKPAELGAKLAAIFEFKEAKELYIRADTQVSYGKVVEAMSIAKLSGIHRMAMLTTPHETKS